MRIQVHDFGGYAFAADLSESLVAQGHDVEHVFSEQYSSNVGDFARRRSPGLTFTALTVGVTADKYSMVGRTRFEIAYARAWRTHTERSEPDVVIAANVPLLPLASVRRWARRRSKPWVLWHQDILSIAMSDELRRRFPPPLGRLGGRVLDRFERRSVRDASALVVIGAAFESVYECWGISRSRYRVVRNWAPLSDITPRPRDNRWSTEVLGKAVRPRVVYTGTLGRKHRPHLLTDLAVEMARSGNPIDLVVVSAGPAAEALRDVDVEESSVTVLPFQPADRLPEVLASADVLVAILEPNAGTFSVPSKVATYFAAGRPVVGLMPSSNSAAADIRESGGFAAEPDAEGVRLAARWMRDLLSDPSAPTALGRRARAFAESAFSPENGVAEISEVVFAAADGSARNR